VVGVGVRTQKSGMKPVTVAPNIGRGPEVRGADAHIRIPVENLEICGRVGARGMLRLYSEQPVEGGHVEKAPKRRFCTWERLVEMGGR